MSETYTVHDPFLGKGVQISDKLTDRLRGKYASGPHLPNGLPEFGWRQFQAPPIQHEAAAVIDALVKALEPFAGEKMPALRRTKIDYDKHGLRRCISPMEIACRDALRALSRVGGMPK